MLAYARIAKAVIMSTPLWKKLLGTYALAWILLALGLGITAVVGWSLFRSVRELDQNRFERQVRQTTDTLRDRIEKYQLALTGLADFAASRPEMTTAEWNFRVRLLQPEKSYPGLLELGIAETDTNAPASRAALAPAIDLDEDGRDNSLFRLLHVWICPPSAYGGLKPGFLNESAVEDTALSAIRANTPCYCYRRELAAEIAGKPARGFTIFVPFRGPGPAQSPGSPAPGNDRQSYPQRQGDAPGVVFGSIEPNLLLAGLFGTAPREVGFDLFGSEPASAKSWLNVSGTNPPSLLPGFKPYLQARVPVQFHTQEWTLVLYTTALFEKESSRYQPWTAVVTGATLSLLIAALLFIQLHARLRVEAVAAELRSACEDLQRSQNERERIGRDLHDGAIQSLYGLQLSLGHYERLRARDAETAATVFDRCRLAVDALIAELRTFIVQQTTPEEEAEMSSDPATGLQKLVQRFQSASSIPIEFVVATAPSVSVPLGAQIHLRQIAQEALSNSLRHGHPRHIKVELLKNNGHLQLRVSDDGLGFDALQAHASGRGLANMQGRAVQLGGALRIESHPGQGTKVILDIPLKPDSSAAHV